MADLDDVLLDDTYFTIKQHVQGGNNFDGSSPPDAKLDADTNYGVLRYPGLVGGEAGRFPASGLFPNRVEVYRIQLDLQTASSWKVELETTDATGSTKVYPLFDDGDYANDIISIHGRALYILESTDDLLVTTTGASDPLYASVTFTPW